MLFPKTNPLNLWMVHDSYLPKQPHVAAANISPWLAYNTAILDMACVSWSDTTLQLEWCEFIVFYSSTNLGQVPVNIE